MSWGAPQLPSPRWQNATERHNHERKHALCMLKQLTESLKDPKKEANWAQVNDIKRLNESLTDLRDMQFGRGEYA